MLVNRLKSVMPSLISLNHITFVYKRIIGDNILLAQSLCKGYNTDRGPSRFSMNLDLHKAFDSFSWDFLFLTLQKISFSELFIDLIRNCVTTA